MTRSLTALALLAVVAISACSTTAVGSTPSPSGAPSTAPSTATGPCPASQPEALAAGEKRLVTIETAKGSFAITVEADLSPIAAGNFVALATCGFYDGVVFHRVVPQFVIQGGDGENGRAPNVEPALVGTGGPGYTISDETVTAIYGRGVVAMARTAQPDSVGSQFFIVLDDEARGSLEAANTYQIIGAVIAGMEVADAIAAAADAEIPSDPIVMNDVSVANP